MGSHAQSCTLIVVSATHVAILHAISSRFSSSFTSIAVEMEDVIKAFTNLSHAYESRAKTLPKRMLSAVMLGFIGQPSISFVASVQ